MENKKEKILICCLIFFILFIINFISAERINNVNPTEGISDVGVKYDKEILDNFNFIEQEKEDFIDGNLKKISDNEVEWVYVSVNIKDFSNIIIPNRNSPDFESKKDERWEIYRKNMEGVLSTLSKNEFQLKSKSEFGRSFSGNITKQGFDKLLNDERVQKIYAKKEFSLSLFESGPLINVNDVWVDYNGTGQTICVIDTGVDYTSSDLGGCFGSGCKVKGGYDYFNDDSNPMDDNGHGTLVAGVII